jgi:hypothetical protein
LGIGKWGHYSPNQRSIQLKINIRVETNNYEVASIRKGVRTSKDLAPRKRGLYGVSRRGSERFLLWCNAATLNRCMIAFRRSSAFVLYSWDLFLAVGKEGKLLAVQML